MVRMTIMSTFAGDQLPRRPLPQESRSLQEPVISKISENETKNTRNGAEYHNPKIQDEIH